MIIADTGFWVAMFDDSDAFHAAAIKVAGRIQEPLITTLPVLTEVCYLLQSRRGQQFALSFLRSHRRGAFRIFEMGESHIVRAWKKIRL